MVIATVRGFLVARGSCCVIWIPSTPTQGGGWGGGGTYVAICRAWRKEGVCSTSLVSMCRLGCLNNLNRPFRHVSITWRFRSYFELCPVNPWPDLLGGGWGAGQEPSTKLLSPTHISHFFWRPHKPPLAYTYTYTYIYLSIYLGSYLSIYLSIHPCIHAYMHTCIHAYMHTCIYACMHMYVCIFTWL